MDAMNAPDCDDTEFVNPEAETKDEAPEEVDDMT